MVEELSQITNICLLITSRISTIPPTCDRLDIPTLSTEAAHDTFYRICKSSEQSDLVDDVLKQLDFHPLSITLLATVAHHNRWDTNRLTEEWGRRRTDVLHTQHNKSLAYTIELSLSSPMFQELGPDAQGLLGVVSFFPQGVDEKKLDWLFPTIPNRNHIFDKFCVLSLTYRYNGSITMLAPLRDYFYPKEPKSSLLLCITKERYLDRLSVGVYPGKLGFEEARWITTEDINIEHLLDVFTTIHANSGDVWDVCSYFMEHLLWHKPRPVLLGPKVEGLPDDHPSKLRCLYELSDLFDSVGRSEVSKSLLTYALKLCRKRGDDIKGVQVLVALSGANRLLGLHEEGIRQAREASKICEHLGDAFELANSLRCLARALQEGDQLDAAEEVASRAFDILPEDRYLVGRCHAILGDVYSGKGEREKAIEHFEVALGIASSLNLHEDQFWIYYSLVELLAEQGRFDDAQAHLERAKSHASHTTYLLGRTAYLQAWLWCEQGRLEEARSEASRAVGLYEKAGAIKYLEESRDLLMSIDAEMNGMVTSDESNVDGELLGTVLFLRPLTLRSKLMRPDDSPDGWLDLYRCIAQCSPRASSPPLTFRFVFRYHSYPYTLSVSPSSRTLSPSCTSSAHPPLPTFATLRIPLLADPVSMSSCLHFYLFLHAHGS